MRKRRSIINRQLWKSFLALSGYFLKSFKVKRIKGADFFTKSKYLDFKARIESLREGTPPMWGSMRIEQMLRHVGLAMGSGMGVYNLPDESYFLSRTVFKWIVINLYQEQPKGLRLPLCMSIPAESQFNFHYERAQLLNILDLATSAIRQSQWKPHCYFGKLTANEWGKLCSIHIDYHLKQFSA